jgi:uncharacterized protein (DUF2384 family)
MGRLRGKDMSEIEMLADTVVRSIEALRQTGLRVVECIQVTDPELATVLLDGFGTAEQAGLWLSSPHPLFGGIPPVELLANNRREEILQVVQITG